MNNARIGVLVGSLVPNFGDAGGLRTADRRVLKAGRLMRSATLCALPPSSIDALTSAVGTGLYLDLRTQVEVERDGAPEALQRHGWSWQHCPVQDKQVGDDSDAPEDFLRRHRVALPQYLRAARTALTALTKAPVVVACSLGKDRTGLVFAVLLRWLGVLREDILADFVLVNSRLPAARPLLPPRWRDPAVRITEVHASTLARLLDELDCNGHATSVPDDTADLVRRTTTILKAPR